MRVGKARGEKPRGGSELGVFEKLGIFSSRWKGIIQERGGDTN